MPGQDNFAKAFIPGLVLGLVIGAVLGAVVPPFLQKSPGPIKGTMPTAGDSGPREDPRAGRDLSPEDLEAAGEELLQEGEQKLEEAADDVKEAVEDGVETVKEQVPEPPKP